MLYAWATWWWRGWLLSPNSILAFVKYFWENFIFFYEGETTSLIKFSLSCVVHLLKRSLFVSSKSIFFSPIPKAIIMKGKTMIKKNQRVGSCRSLSNPPLLAFTVKMMSVICKSNVIFTKKKGKNKINTSSKGSFFFFLDDDNTS